MSGVTPIELMVEGLKKAFEDFVEGYAAPLANKSWTDCLRDPVGTAAVLLSNVVGVSEEHALQRKLFGELKQALDSLLDTAMAENKFFNYLFAYKLVERLNCSAHKFLGPSDTEGKSISPTGISGRNFVPFYNTYGDKILEIIRGYRASVGALFREIDSHITQEDLDKIRSATGADHFPVLLNRVPEALWTEERQRVFFSETVEDAERDEHASAGAGSGAGSGGAGASATVVRDLVCVPAAPVAEEEKTSEQAHGSTPVPGGAS